jgi:hypothetical protein
MPVLKMRANDFRRMALALDGVLEAAHMGHPDFRVQKRIFATLHHDDRFGMVTLTPEQQREYIDQHPDTFAPEAGAWGQAGCTRVQLASADEEVVGEAMTLAWQNAVKKGAARRPSPRKKRGTPKTQRTRR